MMTLDSQIIGRLWSAALLVLLGSTFIGLLFAFGLVDAFGVPQVVRQTPEGPLPILFLDWRVILSAFDCHRLGVDVMVENGCDPLRRVHVYPPIWLEFARTGLTQEDLYWSAPLLIFGYMAICGYQLGRADSVSWGLMLLVIWSPALLFAFERANVDLIIYLLTALSVGGYAARDRRFGWLSDLLVAAAILLKIYPIALLPLMLMHALRAGRWVALARLSIVVALVVGYSWVHSDATLHILQNAPMHIAPEAFGARLIAALLEFEPAAWLSRREFHALFYLMAVALVAPAISRVRWEVVGSTCDRVMLIAGTSILAFCFVAGVNLDYRLLFVAMLIPYLGHCLFMVVDPWARMSMVVVLVLLVVGCWLMWPLDYMVDRPPGGMIMVRPETAWLMKSIWLTKQLALGMALVFTGAIAVLMLIRNCWDGQNATQRP